MKTAKSSTTAVTTATVTELENNSAAENNSGLTDLMTDFEEKFLEVENLCNMLKGYSRTGDIVHMEFKNGLSYENDARNGFKSCIEIFSNSINDKLDRLYDIAYEIRNAGTNGQPKQETKRVRI